MGGKRRYIATTDPDDFRSGDVRLGGYHDDDENCWAGGQVVFEWSTNENRGGRPPRRVERIVDLANKALDRD